MSHFRPVEKKIFPLPVSDLDIEEYVHFSYNRSFKLLFETDENLLQIEMHNLKCDLFGGEIFQNFLQFSS
jgi:hypothetical protein